LIFTREEFSDNAEDLTPMFVSAFDLMEEVECSEEEESYEKIRIFFRYLLKIKIRIS
jgi:hypothetical protein